MSNVRVCGLSEILMYKDWHQQVVSCLDSDIKNKDIPSFSNDTRRLSFFFDDIEKPIVGMQHPTHLICETVLKWAEKDSKILVHCHAGMSRSTSLAIGILISHGYNIVSAVDEVFRQRPHALPNRLMLRIIADILDFDRVDLLNYVNYRTEVFDNKFDIVDGEYFKNTKFCSNHNVSYDKEIGCNYCNAALKEFLDWVDNPLPNA